MIYQPQTSTTGFEMQQKASASPGELSIIWEEISRYTNVLDQLYDRLHPVLKPEYAPPDQTLGEPHPLTSEIATVRSNLAANTSRLFALLERVDL